MFYPVETDRLVIVSDSHFVFEVANNPKLEHIYENTQSIVTFTGNVSQYGYTYPFTSMRSNSEGALVDIRIR